ncbi:MAG: hypothetical protein H6970_09900 [Gammaproteobacteria bacterium]|nr:hypothetical protein [Gammaproteobacteria bacterium]
MGVPVGRRPCVELLGLASQEYYRRLPRPASEKRGDSQTRKRRALESQRWLRSGQRWGLAPPGVRWVRVADAGADIYEYLQSAQAQGHGYVVRAGHNRALVGDPARYLWERVRQVATLGQFSLELSTRPRQAARTAVLSVGAATVQRRAPHRTEPPPGGCPGRP